MRKPLQSELLHCDCPKPFGSHILPIFETSTFGFETAEQAQRTFRGEELHDGYTRYSNPNHRCLEKALAYLEYGNCAQVFASGMGAIATTITSLFSSGDEIICSQPLYGGTFELFRRLETRYGIRFKFVDAANPQNIVKEITERTRGILVEPLANPTLNFCDVDVVARLAREQKKDIIVMADNTFLTPYNYQPLDEGADLVFESLTKYLGGHGDLIGGAVICRSPELQNRIDYALFGAVMDAAVAWRCRSHLNTFLLRMPRHNENALAIASFLEKLGIKVYYPLLASYRQRLLIERLINEGRLIGGGGVVSFEYPGSQEGTVEFLNRMAKSRFVTLAVSLGTLDTLIESPANMTHAHIEKEEREKQGIGDTLIRLAVGTEEPEKIIETIERNL